MPPWRTYLTIQRQVDEILYDEIARRRGNLAGRNDVLSRLLAAGNWSDVELRDQLVTLLLAGHETTATAMGWAFHELARRPEELAFGQRAADAGADDELEAIVKEAMRLHPVVYQVGRRLTETADVAGYRLPRGTTIMAAIGLVHRDGEHFPPPQEFRPAAFPLATIRRRPAPGSRSAAGRGGASAPASP